MRVQELEVKEGEAISPAWIKLREWVRTLTFRAFGGARINFEAHQITAIYDQPGTSYTGHFHPLLIRKGGKPCVTLGLAAGDSLVNGSRVPVIDGVPIDGVLSASQTVDRPALKLQSGPNKDLRSWVCLQALVDPKTGKLDEKNKIEKPLTIVHRNDWDELPPGVDDGHGRGLEALAMLIWREGGTVERIHQIVMHDLKHEYRPPLKDGQRGRHFFLAS